VGTTGVGEYRRLIVERRHCVGWIINNRPEALNAYDDQMRAEFRRAYLQHEADASVKVIVHAAVGRAFQVGVDVSALTDDEGVKHFEREVKEFDLGLTGWQLGITKPVVAAVNGLCAGGGLHWLADSDIVLAAIDATFVDPHVSIGQVSAFEPIGLAIRGPFEVAMRMALVGRYERISATRAYELGLISAVINPSSGLHAAAQEVALQISEGESEELKVRKAAIWRALEESA
jgi:enoyl-CoA hydratase